MCDVAANACPECPFRRDSAPGYLGAASGDPVGFLAPHWHAGIPLPCHMQVDWEADQTQAEIEAKPLCRGLLTVMRNAAKLPENERVRIARENISVDRETFFSFPHEFHQHHGE